MARRATPLAEEEERALLLVGRERVVVAGEVAIEWRVGEGERRCLEGGDGVRGVLEA